MGFLSQIVEKTWPLFKPIGDKIPLEKPIFIVGCPRSGTSIFVDLFSKHRDLANWSEAGKIWDPKHYDDPAAHHVWSAADIKEKDRQRLRTMFAYYQLLARKKRFVNKHPRNSLRLDYIQTIFPDAKFIHIIRDGRAVAGSLMRRSTTEEQRLNIPFGNFCKPPNWHLYLKHPPLEQAAYQWKEIVEFIQDYFGHQPRGTVLELKYEDFCQNVPKHIELVDDFCQLPPGRRLWGKIPSQLEVNNYNYLQTLGPEQIAVIESICGDLLHKLGYPPWSKSH